MGVKEEYEKAIMNMSIENFNKTQITGPKALRRKRFKTIGKVLKFMGIDGKISTPSRRSREHHIPRQSQTGFGNAPRRPFNPEEAYWKIREMDAYFSNVDGKGDPKHDCDCHDER